MAQTPGELALQTDLHDTLHRAITKVAPNTPSVAHAAPQTHTPQSTSAPPKQALLDAALQLLRSAPRVQDGQAHAKDPPLGHELQLALDCRRPLA